MTFSTIVIGIAFALTSLFFAILIIGLTIDLFKGRMEYVCVRWLRLSVLVAIWFSSGTYLLG